MRKVPAHLRALAAAVLAWAASPAVLPAAPAAPDKDAPTVNSAEKLRDALDKVITIKIEKQPLNLAVNMLRDKCGVAFVLDGLTIQQQLGFAPEQPPTPVDVDLKDAKVRTVLRAIVAPYGLSYAVIGDTVVITTEDMAMSRQLHQHVSVDLTKVEFAAALKQISRETAVNLVLDPRQQKEASAKVSMQLEDVPLATAVRLLAEEADLKPVRVGNTLFITSKDKANELRQEPDLVTPVQPGQPVPAPGVFAPPVGLPIAPPPVIGNPPAAAPGVPPAIQTKTDTDNTGAAPPAPPPSDNKKDGDK